jgi:hypothetical protein
MKKETAREFTLKPWYSSEDAKRSLGRICQAVNERDKKIYLSGLEEKPYMVMDNIDKNVGFHADMEITIENLKADWSSVMAAIIFLNLRVRIRGKSKLRAVLYRHPENRHPAFQYAHKSPSDPLKEILESIDTRLDSLEKTASYFKDEWRAKKNLPPLESLKSGIK